MAVLVSGSTRIGNRSTSLKKPQDNILAGNATRGYRARTQR